MALLIAGAIINYADRQIIAILKPLIGVDFHWSDAQYGHLASAFQFASAIGLLFAGRFVDRVGIKWANPIAVGCWSLIAVTQALARTFWAFAAMRVTLGAAEALGTPVAVKSVAILFGPSERSLAFGGMNAAGTLGAVVTPLLVPSVASIWGWRPAFMLVGMVGFVWVIAWVTSAGRSLEFGDSSARSVSQRVSWRKILQDRRTWAIAGAKVLSDQVWWFLLFWAPDLLHRLYHLSIGEAAVPLAMMYCCAALGSILGGFGSRYLIQKGVTLDRARKTTLLVCAVLALPIALIPSIHQQWLTILVLGLTLAAHQGFSVNLFAVIADIVPIARLATVTSVGAFCGNLGGIGILAFTGWVLTERGDYGPVFIIAASSYLLALVWLQLLLPVLRAAPLSDA